MHEVTLKKKIQTLLDKADALDSLSRDDLFTESIAALKSYNGVMNGYNSIRSNPSKPKDLDAKLKQMKMQCLAWNYYLDRLEAKLEYADNLDYYNEWKHQRKHIYDFMVSLLA